MSSEEKNLIECTKCGGQEFHIYNMYGSLLFACVHCGQYHNTEDMDVVSKYPDSVMRELPGFYAPKTTRHEPGGGINSLGVHVHTV